MHVEVAGRVLSTLPIDDDHPYRTGAWQPNFVEYDASDLDVVGEIPDDLRGVYLRNTENPVHPSIDRLYHPFDGDGMLHMVHFHDGRAEYRNRFVRSVGFEAEQRAGHALWSGILGGPHQSLRPDGWGARTRMKDASSTDVVVHAGRALTSFYQCGDLYAFDPCTLEPLGRQTWDGKFPSDWGISAHPKPDAATGEMLVFNYAKTAPFMHYGVVDANNELVHWVDIPLPGPRLPHDMAFTERYAILNDCPLFWDADFLNQGAHVPRFRPDLPTRFAVIPRRGTSDDIRWFEAEPTYVLHWANAYDEGDEIVLDGFFQRDPMPSSDGETDPYRRAFRGLDTHRMQTVLKRWRMNIATGACHEEQLSERIMEFPMINQRFAGRPYRYVYTMTTQPGWFLFDSVVKVDLHTGREERYTFGDGVFASETPFAPRPNGTTDRAEDDGYLVTFTTDIANDCSECLVLDARDVAAGPIARIRLPERISSGTHSWWAEQPG
ncbi:MAG: carotenoid oxygenase family protein [Acidimicrobiia bacterium]